MSDFTAHRAPATLCWHCDRLLDAASNMPGDELLEPRPGAVSLCMYCGAVAIFGDDHRLIRPSEEQLDELAKSTEFRQQFTSFAWARQYLMIKSNLMRSGGEPDR